MSILEKARTIKANEEARKQQAIDIERAKVRAKEAAYNRVYHKVQASLVNLVQECGSLFCIRIIGRDSGPEKIGDIQLNAGDKYICTIRVSQENTRLCPDEWTSNANGMGQYNGHELMLIKHGDPLFAKQTVLTHKQGDSKAINELEDRLAKIVYEYLV